MFVSTELHSISTSLESKGSKKNLLIAEENFFKQIFNNITVKTLFFSFGPPPDINLLYVSRGYLDILS
jgi:hypothetical protein